MSVDRLADVLVHQRDEERERALRALLMQPLLPSSDPAYALVRRHTEYLRDWLARECGWPLLIERDAARLYKRPADTADATRGAPDFGRARYLLLCLVCAVLEAQQQDRKSTRLNSSHEWISYAVFCLKKKKKKKNNKKESDTS